MNGSDFRSLAGDINTDTFGIFVTGPDIIVPPAFPPDNMFASLNVTNCTFSEIGTFNHTAVTIAGIATADNSRLSNIVISGNEFDRLNGGANCILRSVLLLGDSKYTI